MTLPIKKVPNFPIVLIENFCDVDGKYLIPEIHDQIFKLDLIRAYNYPLNSNVFFENLYENFLQYSKLIFGNFHLIENNKNKIWCYFSTQNLYHEVWHNHEKTSTINGVYYLNMPEKGGTIRFKYLDEVIDYLPNENDMLIFPNFLDHCPMQPFGSKPRIAINMEIECEERSSELFQKFLT